MDDILAKKNRHLFLEEKDNVGNSFIANVNTIVDDLDNIDAVANDLERIDTVADNIDNVNTVAENIDDINTTVENLSKIDQFNDNLVGLLESLLEQLGEDGNAWLVRLTELGESILATTSAFNYAVTTTLEQDIASGATLTLPEAMKYRVGTHMLMMSWNGTVCYIGDQYNEVGSFGQWSTTITTSVPLKIGDKIQFRVVALADAAAFVGQIDSVIGNTSVVATGSTENRTLANRFADIVNVKDYGAVGDGVTNDTTAFQNAITTGKAVFVPEGSYKLITDLTGDFCSTGNSIFIGGTVNGSTILRGTVQRNSDIINVKDFGAVGDGVTDDTSTIQAALTAGSGKVVFFPSGTYCISHITASGCRLAGDLNFIDMGRGANEASIDLEETVVDGCIDLTATGTTSFYVGVNVKSNCNIYSIHVHPASGDYKNAYGVVISGDNSTVGFIHTERMYHGIVVGCVLEVNETTGLTDDSRLVAKNIHLQGYSIEKCRTGMRVKRAAFCTIGDGYVSGFPWEDNQVDPAPGYNAYLFEGAYDITMGKCISFESLEHALRITLESFALTVDSDHAANVVICHNLFFGDFISYRAGGAAVKVHPHKEGYVDNIHFDNIISIDAGLRQRPVNRAPCALLLAHCSNFTCGCVITKTPNELGLLSSDRTLENYNICINNAKNVKIDSIFSDGCLGEIIRLDENNSSNSATNEADDVSLYLTNGVYIGNVVGFGIRNYELRESFTIVRVVNTQEEFRDVNIENINVFSSIIDNYITGVTDENTTAWHISIAKGMQTSKINTIPSCIGFCSAPTLNVTEIKSQGDLCFDPSSAVLTSSTFYRSGTQTETESYGSSVVFSRPISGRPGGAVAAVQMGASASGGLAFFGQTGVVGSDTLTPLWIMTSNGADKQLLPAVDATDTYPCNIGRAAKRIGEIFCANATINTSDARLKDNIVAPDDALMRAWGRIRFKIFQFKDAVERKGAEAARLHAGIIAQEVQAAFEAEGLDASRYGLFCHDEWEETKESYTVVDKPAVTDSNGNVVEEELAHTETRIVPAGDRYSIRYGEALALECAYQRWSSKQRDAKIEALMQRISALENNN